MIRRVLVALAALVIVAGAGFAYLQHSQPGILRFSCTLTLSANPAVQTELLHYLKAAA